jgi:hypothetical protein
MYSATHPNANGACGYAGNHVGFAKLFFDVL